MAALCGLLSIGGGLAWGTDAPERRQGLFLAGQEGEPAPAPVLGATVEVRVTGIIARTRVTQIFANPSKEWLEGIYVFPLPADGAVDTLRMKVGDRVIQGIVQEEGEARQNYVEARRQGMNAGLVEQQRADVFTTTVANIGPGETVEVAIELQQVVAWDRDRFRLRFPMVVTPGGETSEGRALRLPPVRRRGAPRINPFAFHADLDPGFPLAGVQSPSHAITLAKGKNFRYAVDLKKGTEPADDDLVLEWVPAVGREPRGVFYSEEVDGERYDLLMVMPPDAPGAAALRLPRETVFIIDTSGSMSGRSIEQARQALLLGLDKLQPTDRFNVVRFASWTTSAFPASVPATPDAVTTARLFVAGLTADGTTAMLPALQIALRNAPLAGFVPQVIFATDGQLDDEREVVQLIASHLGGWRLFPVAIGREPNAALLRQLAALGRGAFTQIADRGEVKTAMATLFARLDAPMLQAIEVQWGDPTAEAWPARAPDLYLGEPLVITARSRSGGGPVNVSGARNGALWQDSFPAAGSLQHAGIDKLWARRKIQALTDSLKQGGDYTEVRRAVTGLGLRHHLVTDFTSLVAVGESANVPPGAKRFYGTVPVNPPRDGDDEAEGDVITVTAESPLLDERRISTGGAISQSELERVPTARDPWAVLETSPGVLTDRINVGGNEDDPPADSAAEVKALAAEVQRLGWGGITLERALAVAPSLAEALRQADGAGLLRGFLVLVLQGEERPEPPAEVLAEAQAFRDRFGVPKG
jgi:Ca-activated chloride channel family protein